MIKCKCGWQGSKYKLIISMTGNRCPDCNEIAGVQPDDWVNIETSLPDSAGQYECRNAQGEFPAFFVRKMGGGMTWLKPSEDLIITHWKMKY